MRLTIQEGDFAICLKDYLFLRRPKKIQCLPAGRQRIKAIKSGSEWEVLVDVVRKTELYSRKQCLDGKKFAFFIAEKKKMNLLPIIKTGGDFAIYRFVYKSRELFCGFLFFVVIFNNG